MKKYTMKDIAQMCGVSTATVSYVLNDAPNQSISAETKKRVLQIANMVGYVSSASAKALATGRTHHFGVYVPTTGNSVHKQRLLQALAEEAEKAGYQLVLLTASCMKQQVTNVDAVFAIDLPGEDFAALGDNLLLPLLFLEGQTENDLFYCVTFDAAALRSAALERTGCRRAALVEDMPHCRDYQRYLADVFDGVYTPEEAPEFDEETAVLVFQPQPLVRAPIQVVLGGESLPLDYRAYAHAVVATAHAAICRADLPAVHHIRI